METYKNIRLYDEICTEMQNVLEAENNAAAWRAEARVRMRDVSALIVAAEKVNKDENGNPIKIDRKALIAQVRAELTPADTDDQDEIEEADAEEIDE